MLHSLKSVKEKKILFLRLKTYIGNFKLTNYANKNVCIVNQALGKLLRDANLRNFKSLFRSCMIHYRVPIQARKKEKNWRNI